MPDPKFRRQFWWLPALLVLLVVIALVMGGTVFRYVEADLVANSGGTLALAAADIADKLDRILFERYGDVQMMAWAFEARTDNAAYLTSYLAGMKQAYPVYLWLGVTDPQGRIVAATDPAGIGQDRSDRPWFQAVRDGLPVHVQDAQPVEDAGGVLAIGFTAPLRGKEGKFLGVVTTRVGLQVLEDVFARTTHALELSRGTSAKIEWQFLNRNGDVILDSILRQEMKVNLRQLGLPSALLSLEGASGYVQEQHLRRRVPVITGYARTGGYGRFTGPQWGVLVRMDRSEVLAHVRAILWKLGLAGTVLWVPLFGLLLWSVRRLRVEWGHAHESEAAARESEERFRKTFDDAPIGMATIGEDFRFSQVNKVLCNMLGYTEKELKGKTFRDVTFSEDVEKGIDDVKRLFRGEERILEMEKRYVRKDRTIIWTHLTVTGIRDRAGRPLYNLAMIEDITERKRADERQATQVAVSLALAESATLGEAAERVLKAVCDTMGWELGLVWRVDQEASLLRCETLWQNPALKADEFVALSRATTFPSGIGLPGRVWASGGPAWILDVVRDPNFPRAPVAAKSGLHGAFGFPVKGRDKILGVIEFFSREIRQPDNNLLAMMADIGLKIGAFVERIHAESERERLTQSLQLLLESTGEGIYGIDMEGRCTFINKAAARMVGYQPTELLGQSAHALIHHSRADGAPYPEALCPIYQTFRSGQNCYVTDEVFWRRDGSSFPVEYTSYPVREKGVVKGAVVTFLDVAERRRAEEAARASEERFRLAIDHADDAILYLDGHDAIVWANQQASVITGQPLEALAGNSLMAAFATQPMAKAQLASIGLGKPVPPVVEFEVFLRDGTSRWLEVTVTHVRKGEDVVGWLLVARDRTERRQIERQLRQSEKMAALGMLLDGVAHELNNPLFMIGGLAQLAGEKVKMKRYDTLADDLASIREAVNRTTEIVQRTLAVARRAKAGGEPCQVNDLVQQTLDLATDDLAGAKITLRKEFQADLPAVLANPRELSQVFLNLIDNARKAMTSAQGRGTLTIRTTLTPHQPKPWVELRVADNGPGIAPELQSRIFEPFSTAQQGSQGTGLSLALCHRIVTELGGTLTVEGKEGQGATFVVRLPALDVTAP